MTNWRPPQFIKVKAIGLPIRDGRFLAAEVFMDDGSVKGIRPLGGSIDFGETREEALAREFSEELGTHIKIIGPWTTFENIYRHEGSLGHEIVFAAEIALDDVALYDREEIVFSEDDGTLCHAKWFNLATAATSGFEVFPTGLSDWLAAKAGI
jgi:ADP-ribose pyrophosphatase YjhB (NUDIX family)